MGGRVIRRKVISSESIKEVFDAFLLYKKASGLSLKTLQSYKNHFNSFLKHLDSNTSISLIKHEDIESWINELRAKGKKDTTIASYIRGVKSFFSWAKQMNYTNVNVKIYKAQPSPKETYTDEELIKLTKRPNLKDCSFCEFRNYTIICFLISTGCRAGSLRYIKCEDIDWDNDLVYFRHMKCGRTSKSIHSVPLSSNTKQILTEYYKYRNGNPDEWLFCTEKNGQLAERGLQQAIKDYNYSKGVSRTSIHAFRHTFAKKYLLDCGGNAFTLQKLLGHSTLDMTLQYCTIFNADLQKNFDNFNPLEFIMKKQSRKIEINK